MSIENGTCDSIRDYLRKTQNDITLEPETIAVFGLLYSLFVTLGVVGNLLVVISVCQHRALHSVRNIFIVSLSCSDIVVSIVSGSVTSITAFTKIWLFGPQLCYLVPLIQGTSLCFSTLTLTAIAIDRFILIIYPTRRPIQRRHAFRMVAFNCTVALAISFPMFLKQKLVKWENFCGKFCTEDWGVDVHMRSVYGTLVLILQFAIPLVIITFCYSMISLQLSKGLMYRNRRDEEIPLSDQRKAALKRRIRTNRMLIAMVGVFFCCWVPSVAFNFLRDYGWLPEFVKKQEYFFGVITHCISMSSTVWNPCLYALMNEQFRVAFASLIHTLKGDEHAVHKRHCSRLLSNTILETSLRKSGTRLPTQTDIV